MSKVRDLIQFYEGMTKHVERKRRALEAKPDAKWRILLINTYPNSLIYRN